MVNKIETFHAISETSYNITTAYISPSNFYKMSSVQLFIGYAHNSCETAQVVEAFENALNEAGIVEKVDFRVKKGTKGEDFKIFFIHFNHENRQLEHMMREIKKNGFLVLTYARQWDKRQNKYIERYWKVLPYVKKEQTEAPAKFVPRIMSLEEAAAAGIAAPKTKTEEPKTEPPKTPEKAKSPTEAPKKPEKVMPFPLDSAPSCWKEVEPPSSSWDDAPLPEVPPPKPKLSRQVAVHLNTQDDEMAAIEELFKPKPKAKRSKRASPEPEVDNVFAKLSLDEKEAETP
jgi:hypothetical protein